MIKEKGYNFLYASQDKDEEIKNSIADATVSAHRKELIKTMRSTEALNQYTNLLNIYNNHESPYSPYNVWDNKTNQYVIIDNKKKFSYIDIESQKEKIPYSLLKNIITEHKETLDNIQLKTLKKSSIPKKFTTLSEKNGSKDNITNNSYVSAIYNAFPKRLRKEAFNKTKEGEIFLTDQGIKKLKNIYSILTGAYNTRSLDSLRDTLGGSTNFAVLNYIDKEEDINHIIDFIDYLLTEGPNRGKKGIFVNRLISLLAFLGDTDLNIVENDFAGLSDEFDKVITDLGESGNITQHGRFKDLYSAVQKLISQPDNNTFLSDLSGHSFNHKIKTTIPQSIEKQCESVINHIIELNRENTSKYVYKIKGMNLANKGLLSADEEKKLLQKLNLNKTIISHGGIKIRTKKNSKVIYNENIIKNTAEEYNIDMQILNKTLHALNDMKTGANGSYQDAKVVFTIEIIDVDTKETKEIGIEIINNMVDNYNDYNQANHNFLESQKHLLSRIRDKGYTTTKHIHGYIRNSILRNASDLLKTRNLIQEGKKLDSMEWFEEQKIYTSRNGRKINLLELTNDKNKDNKHNIDIIAHDLLLGWLEDGRICIDNNTEDRKNIENSLYDDKGDFLHIAFRGNNFINNLESSRLQLNTNNASTKYMGSIIFFPFGGNKKETLKVSTEILWSIIQEQAILNHNEQYR